MDFFVRVLAHQRHFLNHLLLVKKVGEGVLEFLVELLELQLQIVSQGI